MLFTAPQTSLLFPPEGLEFRPETPLHVLALGVPLELILWIQAAFLMGCSHRDLCDGVVQTCPEVPIKPQLE